MGKEGYGVVVFLVCLLFLSLLSQLVTGVALQQQQLVPAPLVSALWSHSDATAVGSGPPQRLIENFLGELLFEMDFNWGFHIIKKRAVAFQVEGRPLARVWRCRTAQRAKGTALHGQSGDYGQKSGR